MILFEILQKLFLLSIGITMYYRRYKRRAI